MTCIMVVGCYRTGSSGVAGILHHLGVFMGDYFDLPSYANTKGYFEDLEFKNHHKEIEKDNFDCDGYKKLIESREEKYDFWGVKDPLLCFFLSNLTLHLNTSHAVINCNRKIEEIAASLTSQLGNGRWDLYAKRYIEAKELELANYAGPILDVDFYEMNHAKSFVQKISDFVDLPVTNAAIEFIK